MTMMVNTVRRCKPSAPEAAKLGSVAGRQSGRSYSTTTEPPLGEDFPSGIAASEERLCRGDVLPNVFMEGEMAVSSTTGKLVVAAGVAIAAAIAYLLLRPAPLPTVTPAPVEQTQAPQGNEAAGPIAPSVRYPIPEPGQEAAATAGTTAPLPDLDASDTVLGEALAGLIGRGGLSELVVLKDLVRRIVVTVDSLPGEQMPWSRSPIRQAEGGFQIDTGEDGLSIAAGNAARYRQYVEFADAIDSARLVEVYVGLYPLFQAAYDELGYPNAYFNDRLVAVIDHLLAAPEVAGPIRLVQPKVRYRFEDPALQQASAGHKIMLRMGTDNARRVKTKLREIRQRLTGALPPN